MSTVSSRACPRGVPPSHGAYAPIILAVDSTTRGCDPKALLPAMAAKPASPAADAARPASPIVPSNCSNIADDCSASAEPSGDGSRISRRR